jgi:Flp pilus assembly protein TadG
MHGNLMQKRIGNAHVYSARGLSIIELTVAITLLVPVILICVDCATLFSAQTLNANVCRQAARAAAAGPPSKMTPNRPRLNAETVVQQNLASSGAIRMHKEVAIDESINRLPVAPFGGSVDGTITVTTSVDVYSPFLVGRIVGKNPIVLVQSQTFPFTYVVPNTIGQELSKR